ncbi:MAG: hypothetical protein J6A75_11730 [Lachnospiraceae bacterium]|nr:hypothetical protein [Lachnospiraceae bacterium]
MTGELHYFDGKSEEEIEKNVSSYTYVRDEIVLFLFLYMLEHIHLQYLVVLIS